MDIKPDPIQILDVITIVRSPSDNTNGPWFYVDARKDPPFIEVRQSVKKTNFWFLKKLWCCVGGRVKICFLEYSSIRSDEGLTLETSAF